MPPQRPPRPDPRAALLGTSRGYWPARALLTAVEIGLFNALATGHRSPAELAASLGVDARALGLLLDALVGQGFLAKRQASYGIHAAYRPLLTEGPDSALHMLHHHARLWERWDRLTECVRRGEGHARESGFRQGADAARDFTLAMQEGARQLAPLVAAEVSWRRARRLLDLGGGPGVYAVAFARANPRLEVVIVDLPEVCVAGRALLEAEPQVAARVRYHEADLDTVAELPEADGAFLSHVIHSQSEEEVRALLLRIRRALQPGGRLVVRDFFLGRDRSHPSGASLFALNMLVNTPRGRTYTSDETRAWLQEAGFTRATFRRSPAVPDTGYVSGRVPK